MATKAELESLKNTLLASNQPILAADHREQVQGLIDEMYDAQSRANVLVGVQSDSTQGANDTFIIFRSGQAYQIPASLFSATELSSLQDVFILNVADGDILRYDSVNDRWQNESLSNILSAYALLTDLDNYQLLSEKGQANGYAQLDSGAKLPTSIIPDSILGQVSYQGTWAASTNTPTLANPPDSSTKGEYYVSSDDGTQFGIEFKTGDWIISNGSEWEKVDNTDAVTSVFGRLGNVIANSSDYENFYVDFTSNQSISGQKTFGSGNLRIVSGGSGNLPAIFSNSPVLSSKEAGFNTLGFNADNDLFFNKGENSGVNGAVIAFDLTDIRTYTLPDASGTLAFTSDIPSDIITGNISAGKVAFGDGNGIIEGGSLFFTDGTNEKTLVVFSDDFAIQGGPNLIFATDGTEKWRITSSGILQSNGEETIQTSTGNLSLATGGGNGDILLTPNGTGNVGIGTTTPGSKLTVVGDANINSVTVGRGGGNITTNTVVGLDAGQDNTTGIRNSFFGRDAGYENTSGDNNSFFGTSAGKQNTTGSSNSLFGRTAGFANTTGSENSCFGRDAGRFISSGGNTTVANNSVFIGYETRALADNQTNQIVIGHSARGVGSNSVVLGNTSILTTVLRGNVGIGTTTPGSKLSIVGLPTSSSGLSAGDIYNDGGTLKIV